MDFVIRELVPELTTAQSPYLPGRRRGVGGWEQHIQIPAAVQPRDGLGTPRQWSSPPVILPVQTIPHRMFWRCQGMVVGTKNGRMRVDPAKVQIGE